MAQRTLSVRQKQKYDTSTNWATNNPVLLAGEIGIESDTHKMKAGDGVTAWNSLGYISIPYTETDPTVPSWAKQANKPTYDYSEISNTPTIPTQVTSVDGLSGGTISSAVTVNGNITGQYVEGTWLKSTAATDTGSWTDVWVNSGGWLYKRSKENFKSDLNIPDTSNFVTTNTEQTLTGIKTLNTQFKDANGNVIISPAGVEYSLLVSGNVFGHSSARLNLMGKTTRPYYYDNTLASLGGKEVALLSDVNNGSMVIKKNGSLVNTFYANQSEEKVADIALMDLIDKRVCTAVGTTTSSGYIDFKFSSTQKLRFAYGLSKNTNVSFGFTFTTVLWANTSDASTGDTQSQRTTLNNISNTGLSCRSSGDYPIRWEVWGIIDI